MRARIIIDTEGANNPVAVADCTPFTLAEPAAPKPRCQECPEPATYSWERLAVPVHLCDSCYHDAVRSGWEPGQ